MSKRARRIVFALIFIASCVGFLFVFKQIISQITSDTLKEFGAFAGVLLFAIQVLQVLIAIIPGEPIEVLAGTMFGSINGLLICTAGIILGTFIIFVFMKKYKHKLLNFFFDSEDVLKYDFLKNEKKLDILVFFLFFIPGTPKDLLTFLVPLTPMKISRFLVISSVARIPSVISSTYAGETLSSGNFVKTLLIFLVIGIISLVGILINNKFINSKKKP